MAVSRKNRYLLPAGLLILVLLAFADLLAGGQALSPGRVLSSLAGGGDAAVRDIILGIRIPRILSALICGAALGLAGVQMQAVFRNPLADPHIMGVSGGAGLGAAIATTFLWGGAITSTGGPVPMALAAFAGAAAASFLVIAVSARISSASILLIFGVMLGFIFNAMTSILEYSAGEESLKLFYSWSAGSFSGNRYTEIGLMGGALSLGGILAAVNSKGLDIILFGDDYARASGAPVGRIRLGAMVSCCLITGAVTAFCGPIGFVGIVSGHIARSLLHTARHRTILPASMVTGGIIVLTADLLSQCSVIPLPVGSTMALIGIPLIFVILSRKNALGH